MNLVLRGLTWNIVLAWCFGASPGILYWPFLDDALVLGRDFGDHLTNLRSVFTGFREFDLKFKPKKCALFQRRVEFLGRQISRQGVEMGDSYVEAIRYWPAPRSTKDVERFLGFANYHRGFI